MPQSRNVNEKRFEYISILLERCYRENKFDTLYPVLTNVAKYANDKAMPRSYEPTHVQSIH